MASEPIPGELAAHTDHPTTASQIAVVAPASRKPVSRAIRLLPSGSTTGMTAIGNKQAEQRGEQHPAVHEVTALAHPVDPLHQPTERA